MPEQFGALIRDSARAHSQLRQGGLVGALPQRSRPGGGQLARRGDERRAPGRMHDQRPGRARRQRVAGGDRHGGAARARTSFPATPASTPRRSSPAVEAGVGHHRLPGAAEQGDRRRQRLRARIRHPPGRRAQAPRDLRDHARRGRGLEREQAGAGQALGPQRLQDAARRARASSSGARRRSTHAFARFKDLADKKARNLRRGPAGAGIRRAGHARAASTSSWSR